MNTVKNGLMFLMMGCSVYSFAQVGINNTSPNATLDVTSAADDISKIDGVIAPRITGTQLRNKDNLYNAAQDGTIVYVTQPLTGSTTTNRTRNILVKGYYNFDSSRGPSGEWVRMFNTPSENLAGAIAGSAHPGAAVTISSTNSNLGIGNLETRTFVITERSLVTFNVSVPVADVFDVNGNNLIDGTSKGYGINLYLSGGGFNNYLLARQGASFTNSASFYTNGIFQVGATRFLILDPGTYTADLTVFVFSRDIAGIRASFGVGADTVFDIISSPKPN